MLRDGRHLENEEPGDKRGGEHNKTNLRLRHPSRGVVFYGKKPGDFLQCREFNCVTGADINFAHEIEHRQGYPEPVRKQDKNKIGLQIKAAQKGKKDEPNRKNKIIRQAQSIIKNASDRSRDGIAIDDNIYDEAKKFANGEIDCG